jgi:hypothetical protein
MATTDKILQKIKKVLELSKNNPSEEEAKSAALKAQRLMAEYHIEMVDLDKLNGDTDITSVKVAVGNGNKWKSPLAYVVSKNFRCRYYFYGRDTIMFYGHKIDAEIAAETFKFFFAFGNKKANQYYTKIRAMGNKSTKGIKNTYLVSYLEGISEVLEKQSTALMIITPQDVEDGYLKLTGGDGFKTKEQSGLRIRVDEDNEIVKSAKREGRAMGRNVAQSRSIESKG